MTTIGFGQEPYGDFLYGEADWSSKVTYGGLPTRWRNEDDREGNPLRSFLEAYQGELDDVRFKIRRIVDQRDPNLAIANNVFTDVKITSSEVVDDEFWGRTVKAFVQLGEAMTDIGPGWQMSVQVPIEQPPTTDPLYPLANNSLDKRVYKVVRIRTRNDPDSQNEVLLAGVQLPLPVGPVDNDSIVVAAGDGTATLSFFLDATLFEVADDSAFSVIVPTTSGSPVSETFVLVAPGDGTGILTGDNGSEGTLSLSNGGVTIDMTLSGDTSASGVDIVASWENKALRFQHPSMLQYLAADFDVLIDNEEPEAFQRSAVANAVTLRSIKSNAQSYAIRGDMAGFIVEAIGLYRLDTDTDPSGFLPANDVYEIPEGSNQWYTSIEPQFIRFDEISGDLEFDDPDTGTISFLDREGIYDDNSIDGLSPGKAFAENVLEGYHNTEVLPAPPQRLTQVSSTVLDPDVPADAAALDTLMMTSAFRVVVGMTERERGIIGAVTKGVFLLVNDVTETSFPIERIDDLDASGDPVFGDDYNVGAMEWTVFTSADVPAGDYKLAYFPKRVTDCTWCRSNVMVLEIQNTPELIAAFGGSGTLVQAAYDRLIPKLLKLVPVHVRFGGEAKKIVFNVGLGLGIFRPIAGFSDNPGDPPPVQLFIEVDIAMIAPFEAYYDDIPADGYDNAPQAFVPFPMDTVGVQISLTIS